MRRQAPGLPSGAWPAEASRQHISNVHSVKSDLNCPEASPTWPQWAEASGFSTQ
jgi:hypothetical protein